MPRRERELQAWADDTWDTDLEARKEKAKQRVELPVLSALIEHPNSGEKWLWDLGMANVSAYLHRIAAARWCTERI